MSEPMRSTPDPGATDPARELGRDLVVTIRVARDGRVFFQDIPPDMVAVAAGLRPDDDALAQRARILNAYAETRS